MNDIEKDHARVVLELEELKSKFAAYQQMVEQYNQRWVLFQQESTAALHRLQQCGHQILQGLHQMTMTLQANSVNMAELKTAINSHHTDNARRSSLQSASNGEQESSSGKRKRGASPNTPQKPYKRARVAHKGEGSIEVNSEDTINQTVTRHLSSASRDSADTAFGLVAVSNTSAPMAMISLDIDGGRQPSYQPANNVGSDNQCESINLEDRQEGVNNDDVEDEITNSMFSQLPPPTSPLPSETSRQSFEQGPLVTPTISQRSVELAPLLMPTNVKSMQSAPALHDARWQTDRQQAYSELPRQPIVIQQQINTLPPPPQLHNEQDLQCK
uniref:Uncharacterized protein n=1 Tax=Plectus sambesii TaxID=2011161 RepID=A0A914XPK3_9BILA